MLCNCHSQCVDWISSLVTHDLRMIVWVNFGFITFYAFFSCLLCSLYSVCNEERNYIDMIGLCIKIEWFNVFVTAAETRSNQNNNQIHSSLFLLLVLFIYGYGRIDCIAIVNETIRVYERASYDILALLQAMTREYYRLSHVALLLSLVTSTPTVTSITHRRHHPISQCLICIPNMKTDAVSLLQVLQLPKSKKIGIIFNWI